MELFVKNSGCSIYKLYLIYLFIFIYSTGSCDLSGALIDKTIVNPYPASNDKIDQNEGFIKGRITHSVTNTAVGLADIFTFNKRLFVKSNSQGDFIIGPLKFPASLRIRKFGFKEETIIVNNPGDPVLISLVPLEVHNSYSGKRKLLQYEDIFNKAIVKLRMDYSTESKGHSLRELVYCRICSSVDSTTNSLFEGYANMNVGNTGLADYQSSVSRYASTDDNIPGLTGNRLEFKIDPYVNLPIMAGRFITRKGYLLLDGKQIAMVKVDLGNTLNTYYINVSDTSVLYITSRFRLTGKEHLPGSRTTSQTDQISYAEISFSHPPGGSENYFIDWVSMVEEYGLVSKMNPKQNISRSITYIVIPDSSVLCDAARDAASHEALTELKRQVNFRVKLSQTHNSSAFDSETEKLLQTPYRPEFWARNSCIIPDKNELKQIASWEKSKMFYSEERIPPENEIISSDSIAGVMNNNLVAVENVFVGTDRSDYLAGDTIWFSAFILDNLHMDSTSLSRILYVDLINTDNKPEKHLKLIIINGRAYGDFSLKKDAKDGIYLLRAYTQYMRNFQEEYLFEKEIIVHRSDFSRMILVNPVIRRSIEGDSVELHLRSILPVEYGAQDKMLEVVAKLNDTLSVRKTFNIKRSFDESMGFFVPSSLVCPFVDIRLILSGNTVISEQRMSIPLRSGINLQFFPESGKLIDGIRTAVAFKTTDDRGNPAKFDADITDEYDNRIGHISGDESGIGKFEITPAVNHTYSALVNLRGNKYSFGLPPVEPKGYVLNFNADSSYIDIKSNQESLEGRHYLLLSVRGAVYAAIETKLDNRPLKVHLPLNMYPKGIVQVTLYDSLFRPQAERLVFNKRPDLKMLINVETDKKIYSNKEKVKLTLKVTDVAGNPVTSSLSLAVVDGSKSDSTLNSPDIESYIYLTSELKGRIDTRLLNLSDTTQAGDSRTDLVMMTQGWRNYLWNSIRFKNSFRALYPIEKGFSIDGSVFNDKGRSCNGYKLSYLDFKSGFNGVTMIDENNKFKIDIPLHYNSHDYFIQNKNERGRIEKLSFILDTFPLPVIAWRKNELPFVSVNTGYLNALERKFSEIDSVDRLDIKLINLPEVKVTARANRTGYTAPDKTIDLDKTDPTGKKYYNLYQLIYQEFGEKAFTATGWGTHGKTYFPILVVNGAPLTEADCPPCYDYNAVAWATSIPVNEISDVKFYEAESKYSQWLSPPPAGQTMVKGLYLTLPPPKIYLPVVSFKTYSNSYRGNPKGAIMFPYQGIYMAREFYKPDYEKKNTRITDNRTTIYWDPEVQTDSTGKATISFYNSDLKGKAVIRVSGVSFMLKDVASSTAGYLSQ